MSHGPPGVLLVHAHPDDESINNGVTMAACVELGVPVTLVTCTRGEEGEVIPASLAALAAEHEDRLGPYRAGELAAAMAELGVGDHRFLTVGRGGRTPRDSGMMGLAQNGHPDAFWGVDVDRAAASLAAVIREVRPATLITYDPDGGYGHPDHIQAHRVATRAAELAAAEGLLGDGSEDAADAPPHRVARVLWNSVPRSLAEAELARLRTDGPASSAGVATLADIPGVVDDDRVTWRVVGSDRQIAAKAAAMSAHRTQVELPPAETGAVRREFVLSNSLVQPLWGTEWYRLADGEPFGADDAGPFLPVASQDAAADGPPGPGATR
ncbi:MULTISPECIES: N-acetyl-1-D-myo-inositol-2-amino-2-deoxy-alpha-D-glucopyranoside deacetylase [unclassified Streptomyces]|uniref:N-acetyl-1-D-myo-inositol-2-amino-2-deoxy-alpha- D-glucopyranoside deacetylase n=1 Tax=unclassified Streptomyces TaxID=2593676 RepID=UPI000CD52D2B|nr:MULTISPECIES: N-acetyl-1-D-myo-inositol-2-amino-2-deoxy-alpha-D-glucopyranoside deacetylase [unclassified Streptomyces]